jgi:hypothetical protein
MPSKVPQTQMRLGEETLAALDWIASHYGLPSRSAAARYAIARFREQHGEAAKPKPEKKSRKKSPKGD